MSHARRQPIGQRQASSCLARWTLDEGEIAIGEGTRDASGGPVVGVRDRALPYGLEGGRAQLHHRGIIRQLMLEELTIPGEVAEPDEPVIEQPEVITRKR